MSIAKRMDSVTRDVTVSILRGEWTVGMMTETDSRDSDMPVAKVVRSLRHYPLDLKRRMVEETFAPGSSVSIVARRHDVNANLLFEWRKKYREGRLGNGIPGPRASTTGCDLVRVGVIDADSNLRPLATDGDSSAPSASPPRAKRQAMPESRVVPLPGIIEIELPNRVKVRVDAAIGEAALRRVLSAAGAAA